MDVIDSHYEYVVEQSQTTTKQQAYRAMNRLEGWCSKEKASTLIDLIYLAKAKTVVEIGVWGGKSLVPMGFALRETGGKAYGIDPWSSEYSIDGMEGVNKDWWGTVDHENIMLDLLEKIHQFNLDKQIELIRSSSEEADPIGNIDVLHIDGNHSEKTSMIDVNKWVPLVRSGGFVIFDDINWGTTDKAVKYLDETCVKIAEISGDNIWGIWVKP
jgi:predicted O-methyltransferase YrrM